MNRALYRTSSAGGGVNRLGNTSRPTSGTRAGNTRAESGESRALREQVSYLQHELLISKAEAKKVTDQLSCLVDLIKRAWTGDKTANIHVANIVGVAPPDLITGTHTGIDNVTVATKPKSRAVNHWAVLTIGLLNREYRRMEKELEAKQLCYFQRRQDYLEEQLLLNRDQMLRLTYQSETNHDQSRVSSAHTVDSHAHDASRHMPPGQKSAPQERHCTSPVEGPTPPNGVHSHHYGWQQMSMPNRINVNKPPSASTQRKTSANQRKQQNSEPEVDLTWADLVIEPLNSQKINKATNMTMDGLYRLPKQAPEKVVDPKDEEFDEDRIHLAYDDPSRYAQNGLFSVGEALSGDVSSRSKRPLSAKMRHADSARARPKSAVVKQERPLKYETTRPISAPKAKDPHIHNNKKHSSLTQPAKQYRPMDKVAYERNPLHQEAHGRPGTARSGKGEAAAELERRRQRLLQEDPELAELIQVDVTQPECIKEFDNELLEMHHKETNFKRRAVELQKKLGISSGGILYPDL